MNTVRIEVDPDRAHEAGQQVVHALMIPAMKALAEPLTHEQRIVLWAGALGCFYGAMAGSLGGEAAKEVQIAVGSIVDKALHGAQAGVH
ncbi:MAG: hypothetical protein HY855_02715 [Burkholderiales bacterium]|nr:hypothetical protein [Burkholderiales bacterium]